MKKIIVMLFLSVRIALITTADTEPFRTMENIVMDIKHNEKGTYYAVMENHGKVSIFNHQNNLLCAIDNGSSAFEWIDNDTLAIAIDDEIQIHRISTAKPVLLRKIKAEGKISAIAIEVKSQEIYNIYYGTVSGGTYVINFNSKNMSGSSSELLAFCKTEVRLIFINYNTIIIISQGENPRLYNTNTKHLEGYLVQEKFSEITAAALIPDIGTITIATKAGEILEYNTSLSSYYDVLRKPVITDLLGSPVLSLSCGNRYMSVGMSNSIAFIDREKSKNDKGYITSLNGLVGGSHNGISRASGGGYIISAGRNLFHEIGADAGVVKLLCKTTDPVRLLLTYPDDRKETKTFYFYNGTAEWRVPHGNPVLTLESEGFEIEGKPTLVIGKEPIEVTLKAKQFVTPEPPFKPEFPVTLASSGDDVIVSYTNFLSIWIKKNNMGTIIKTVGTAHILAGHNGRTAAAFDDKVIVYNNRGNQLYSVKVEGKPDSVALVNDILAVGINNILTVFKEGKSIHEVSAELPIKDLAISANTSSILLLTDRSLWHIDIGTKQKSRMPLDRPVPYTSVSYSESTLDHPQGRYILVSYNDGVIRLADSTSGEIVKEYSIKKPVTSIEIHGETIFAYTNNELIFVNRQTGAVEATPVLECSAYTILSSKNIAVIKEDRVVVLENRSEVGQLAAADGRWWFRSRTSGKYASHSNDAQNQGEAKLPF